MQNPLRDPLLNDDKSSNRAYESTPEDNKNSTRLLDSNQTTPFWRALHSLGFGKPNPQEIKPKTEFSLKTEFAASGVTLQFKSVDKQCADRIMKALNKDNLLQCVVENSSIKIFFSLPACQEGLFSKFLSYFEFTSGVAINQFLRLNEHVYLLSLPNEQLLFLKKFKSVPEYREELALNCSYHWKNFLDEKPKLTLPPDQTLTSQNVSGFGLGSR